MPASTKTFIHLGRLGRRSPSRWRLPALVLVAGFLAFTAPAQEHPQLSPASGQQLQQAAAADAAPDEVLEFTETVQEAAEKPGWVEQFPLMVRFMIGVTIMLIVPSISRRCHLPPVVGLILTGIICGPYVLGMMRHTAPVLAMFAEIGRLLLLFYAGLEIDLALFNQAKWRTTFFGLATFLLPLGFGVALGVGFGYTLVAAVLIGSLLASHTLIGYPVVERYGLLQREPVIVTVGATIFTDTLSLTLLTVCVSVHKTGFDGFQLAKQLVEIAAYIGIVLFGLGRLARWFFTKFQPEPEVQMLVLLFIVGTAGLLAEVIDMESIVGAFMAGLAVNRALRGTPTQKNIEVLGKTLFLPAFFIAIGLAINLPEVWLCIRSRPGFVLLMTAGLISAKFLAAWITGAVYGYSRNDRLNMWSLSMPQVAATIAAALVAYKAIDSAGHRLIGQEVLSSILVMVLATAISGPILTEVFSKRIKAAENGTNPAIPAAGVNAGNQEPA
jgi:Kef-type K+ transport system membrane component KefB